MLIQFYLQVKMLKTLIQGWQISFINNNMWVFKSVEYEFLFSKSLFEFVVV